MTARLPLADLVAHVEHFQHRVIQDALAEATGGYWRRRGAAFADARPRCGDFHGHADRDALQARWDRLTDLAAACRAAAVAALLQDETDLATAHGREQFATLHGGATLTAESVNDVDELPTVPRVGQLAPESPNGVSTSSVSGVAS